MTETAFQADAFQNDAFQIIASVVVNNDRGDWPGAARDTHRKRPSRKERERLLDLALQKAFEPKRRKVVKELPWLAEPIPVPVSLPVPEFNPTLAALQGELGNLQAQLAQIQFNRSQEEADIELLLLAL